MLLMFSVSELSSEEFVMIWLEVELEMVLVVVLEMVLVVVDVTLSNCTADGWRDMMASPN